MYPATLVGGILNLYLEVSDPDWALARVLGNIYLEMTYPNFLLEYIGNFTLDQELKPLDMGIAEQVVNVTAEVNGSENLGEPSGSLDYAILINGTEYAIWHYHTITALDDAHSTINASGQTSFWYDQNAVYTFSADSGYKISQVLVDGVAVSTTSPYTFSLVEADHTISVTSAINSYIVTLSQSGPLWQGDEALIKVVTTIQGGTPVRAIFNVTKDGTLLHQNLNTTFNSQGTEASIFFTDREDNWQGHTYTVTGVCDTNGNSVGFSANSLDLMWQPRDEGNSGNPGDSGTGDTGDTNSTNTGNTNNTQGGGTGTSPLPVLPTNPGLTPEQSQVVGYSLLGIIVIVLVIVAANLNQKKKKKFGRAGLGGGVKGFKRNDKWNMKKMKRKA